jgi:hypothetical protein
MAFKTKDGQRKSSKFRANRADREHGKEDKEPKPKSELGDGGPRSMANKMEAKSEGNPEQHAHEEEGGGEEGAYGAEERAEESLHPGIHEEIKGVVAQHGPAHTIHIQHDPERMTSHVHSIHADGHEHHADHQGHDHIKMAHEHASHAGGMGPAEEAHGEEHPDEGGPMGGDGEESFGEL